LPCSFLPIRIFDIEPNAHHNAKQEYYQGYPLHNLLIQVCSCQFEDEKMNIGNRVIVIPQLFSYKPVPVGAHTIAPAIPDTQDEPG